MVLNILGNANWCRKQKELLKLKYYTSLLILCFSDVVSRIAEVHIVARNRKVITKMREKYRTISGDDYPLPVFCVSNLAYAKHLAGYEKTAPPPLSLKATGIPALRNHLYRLPSEARFATLEHHCTKSLLRVVNTMEMSVSVSKLERKEALDEIVVKAHEVSFLLLPDLHAFLQIRRTLESRLMTDLIPSETNSRVLFWKRLVSLVQINPSHSAFTKFQSGFRDSVDKASCPTSGKMGEGAWSIMYPHRPLLTCKSGMQLHIKHSSANMVCSLYLAVDTHNWPLTGVHSTKKIVVDMPWNEYLLQTVRVDLVENPPKPFDSIHNKYCEQLTTGISDDISMNIDNLDETLESGSSHVTTEKFDTNTHCRWLGCSSLWSSYYIPRKPEGVQGRWRTINHAIEENSSRPYSVRKIPQPFAKQDLMICSKMQLRATSDASGHYFTEVMKKIYDNALATRAGHEGRKFKTQGMESLI